MRFWTFATVVVVVALVITDVSARKSNRDIRTTKNEKQKQNDFHASHQKERRMDDVLTGGKKAKRMINFKEIKRRSVDKEESKYERKEYAATTKNTRVHEDKEQTSATIKVKPIDFQFGKKSETLKKSGKFEKLRKSKEIVEDTVGGTEDHVPNGKKSEVKENLEKLSKAGKRRLTKDEEKSERPKVARKEKIARIEEAAIGETENMVEIMKNKEIEDSLCVEGGSTSNDEVEVQNSKKCTCNEDVVQERTENEEVQLEEELESCRKNTKFKSEKYVEKKQNDSCKSH